MNHKFDLISFTKFFSFSIVSFTLVYFFNIILTNFFNWPGSTAFLKSIVSNELPLDGYSFSLSSFQFISYFFCIFGVYYYLTKINKSNLKENSQKLSNLSAYITRSAFWTVFLVGLVDLVISFLVSEKAILDSLPQGLAQFFFTT